jgi:putative SOS response-associated peptidase YedK
MSVPVSPGVPPKCFHGRRAVPARRQGEPLSRELVIGQWGLVPWFAKTAKLTYSTNNARFEEITTKASFKSSWTYGKRCIIPAVSFDEPNWESGKNVWWRFRRADGAPWGLAGLWNTWTDKTTGEVVESYPMLTLNADIHPLMNRMHKPDRSSGPTDRTSGPAVPIELDDVDAWLNGSPEAAAALVRLAARASVRCRSRHAMTHGPTRPAVMARSDWMSPDGGHRAA